MSEGAGWLWLAIAVGLVVLAAAIVYGITMWRNRRKDPQIRAVRDEVTHANYE